MVRHRAIGKGHGVVNPLSEPAVRSVLERGRQAYVAVASPAGPHVTPELYSVADGRLWFWSAATTVKVQVLGDDRRVAATVRAGSRSVVLTGKARTFDPKDLRALPRALREPRAIGAAAVRFGLRNAADLGAFAADFARGRLGRRLPPRRVLVGVKPTRVAVLDGGAIVLALGAWADAAPAASEAVGAGNRDAVVAWETAEGPVALPGRADPEEHAAWLPPAAVALADLPSPARVGVVVDDYVAPGPAAKEGTLLRGTGTLHPDGRVDVEPDRTTDWQGVASRTHPPR
jgi:hypothetical protein